MKKNLLLVVISSLMIGSSATAYSQYKSNIILNTEFKDVYGTINTPVYIKCNSSVSISNTTSADKKYILGTKVCRQNRECVDNRSNIVVKKSSEFKNTYYTIFQPIFTRTGQKPIQCINYVSGSEDASQVKDAIAFIT